MFLNLQHWEKNPPHFARAPIPPLKHCPPTACAGEFVPSRPGSSLPGRRAAPAACKVLNLSWGNPQPQPSPVPFLYQSPASSYSFSSGCSNGSSKLPGPAPPAWAPPPVRAYFLAWGSNHVGKMGSFSWSTPHNSEIHRSKAWGGKRLTSLQH